MIGPSSDGQPSGPWKTIVGDSLGLIALIWTIPVAILVVGAPIVLAVALILMAARAAFG